jgi:hypothetical protein
MAQAGYYNTAPNTQSDSFYTETVDSFANLAMAATADKDLIPTLTSTNAAFTGQLVTKDKLIANLQAQIHNTTNNTNAEHPPTQSKTKYCCLHGTRVSRNHNNQN